MNRKLYVGNLAFSTEERAIEDLFTQAGPVDSVSVVRDRETGRSRGFGFVEMGSDEGARAAIEKFHEAEFEGRRLTVSEARPQEPRGDRGGGFAPRRGPGGGGGNGGNGFGGGGGGNRRREPRW